MLVLVYAVVIKSRFMQWIGNLWWLELNHKPIEIEFRVECVKNIQIQLHIDYDINVTTCKFSVTFRIMIQLINWRRDKQLKVMAEIISLICVTCIWQINL